MYQPMNCELHDYIEACCVKRYKVQLELLDGRVLRAVPVTTSIQRTLVTDQNGAEQVEKAEWLTVRLLDGPVTSLDIRLDQLAALTPEPDCKANFGRVIFHISSPPMAEH